MRNETTCARPDVFFRVLTLTGAMRLCASHGERAVLLSTRGKLMSEPVVLVQYTHTHTHGYPGQDSD